MKIQVYSLLLLLLASCSGTPDAGDQVQTSQVGEVTIDKAELLQHISDLEKSAMASSGFLDTTVANQLLNSYQEFYTHFNSDTLSAQMLFRGADIARGLGRYRKTIELLTNLHDGFPNYSRRDEVAFLIAFTWDANLKDTTRAVRGYNQVIDLYPESRWSEEARNNIRFLQMTESELLEFLKKKNS